ncbi:MAG: 5-formyltetrahydrofolate cyclo-ligase [Rhodospirillales bacterium]
MMSDDIAAAKKAMRVESKERRREASEAAGPGAAAMFSDSFFSVASELGIRSGVVVAGYWAMADEFDVRPALERMVLEDGVIGALPVVVENGAPLIFRQWRPGLRLESGGFGTHHPPESVPECIPDVVLVPLLAFDKRGYRVGWGGGFYDRTLQKLRKRRRGVVAVGTAYAGQEVESVVHDELDQPVDWIITEQGATRIVPQ